MLRTQPILRLSSIIHSSLQELIRVHRVHEMREELCEDTLAYDLEF